MTSAYHFLLWRGRLRSKTSGLVVAGIENCRPDSTYRVSLSNCTKNLIQTEYRARA